MAHPIVDSLIGKTKEEKANIKSAEILKVLKKGKFKKLGSEYEIEVIDTAVIDGGIEIFARAWKNDVQVGFGVDGTIDIERFRIHNPPILVNYLLGDIVYPSSTDSFGVTIPERKLKEDPEAAIADALTHSVKVSAKEGTTIVPNSRGNTTDTFYPSYDCAMDTNYFASYDNAVSSTTGRLNSSSATSDYIGGQYYFNGDGGYVLFRCGFTFATGATIPGGNTVSAATFSVYGTGKQNQGTSGLSINVYSFAPANESSYAATDIDAFGTTDYATAIAYASLSTAGYNDFTLNASGRSAIVKGSGNTVLGTTESDWDTPNRISTANSNPSITPPNPSNNYLQGYHVDQTGTANDPVLVVTHAAGATTPIYSTLTLMGVG
jgi:hypothetical protein